jgi:hypothetical protein
MVDTRKKIECPMKDKSEEISKVPIIKIGEKEREI